MKKKRLLTAALTIITVLSLAGCGTDTKVSDSSAVVAGSQKNVQSADNTQVKKVKIGTGASTKPWIYTNDKDEIIGYDAEIIYAIDELLPEYEFEFEKTDFSSIFLGVDSGIYQMGVNNISWKEERAEKYLFSDEYVGYNYTGIIVKKGNEGLYKKIDDLAGKKTYCGSSGLFSQIFIEKYNESNPSNPILQQYTEADTIKQYQDIVAGVVDFQIGESVLFDKYVESYPDLANSLTFVTFSDEETKSIQDPYSYFIYPKNEEGEALKAAVDGALKTLKENGTVTEIALKYYGYDTVGK